MRAFWTSLAVFVQTYSIEISNILRYRSFVERSLGLVANFVDKLLFSRGHEGVLEIGAQCVDDAAKGPNVDARVVVEAV